MNYYELLHLIEDNSVLFTSILAHLHLFKKEFATWGVDTEDFRFIALAFYFAHLTETFYKEDKENDW